MVLCGISTCFQVLSPCLGQIVHALLTRPPLEYPRILPKLSSEISPFDLHVLSTPPAFVLSQDQTLMFNPSPSPQSPLSARQSAPLPPFQRRFTHRILTLPQRLPLPASAFRPPTAPRAWLCASLSRLSVSFSRFAAVFSGTPVRDSLISISKEMSNVNISFDILRTHKLLL